MAQPAKAFAQPDDVRSIPETHRIKGKGSGDESQECRASKRAHG